MQDFIGMANTIHLLPRGCHKQRALNLHHLSANAGRAAIARIKIEIVHPAGGCAVHALHRSVPAAVDGRRDNGIVAWVLQVKHRDISVIDKRLHLSLKIRFVRVLPIRCLGDHALQRTLQTQRRTCRRYVWSGDRYIHGPYAHVVSNLELVRGQTPHQRFEIALITGIEFKLVVIRHGQRCSSLRCPCRIGGMNCGKVLIKTSFHADIKSRDQERGVMCLRIKTARAQQTGDHVSGRAGHGIR